MEWVARSGRVPHFAPEATRKVLEISSRQAVYGNHFVMTCRAFVCPEYIGKRLLRAPRHVLANSSSVVFD